MGSRTSARAYVSALILALLCLLALGGCGSSGSNSNSHLSAGGYAALVANDRLGQAAKGERTLSTQLAALKGACLKIAASASGNNQAQEISGRCQANIEVSMGLIGVGDCKRTTAAATQACLILALREVADGGKLFDSKSIVLADGLSGSCQKAFLASVVNLGALTTASAQLANDLTKTTNLHKMISAKLEDDTATWKQALTAFDASQTAKSKSGVTQKEFTTCAPKAK